MSSFHANQDALHPPAAAPSATTRRKTVGSTFVSKSKFANDIPPLPFDPKSLRFPLPPNVHAKYSPFSCEKTMQYPYPQPSMPVDLSVLGLFDGPSFEPHLAATSSFEQADIELMTSPDGVMSSKKSAAMSLRIAHDHLAKAPPVEPQPTTTARQLKITTGDRADQIRCITSTFDACREKLANLVHPRNPHVTAVRVMPIVPSLALYANVYADLDVPKIPNTPPSHVILPHGSLLKNEAADDQTHRFAVLGCDRADPDIWRHVRTYVYENDDNRDTPANSYAPLRLVLRIPTTPPTTTGEPGAYLGGVLDSRTLQKAQCVAEYILLQARFSCSKTRLVDRSKIDPHTFEAMEEAANARVGPQLAFEQPPIRLTKSVYSDVLISDRAAKYINDLGLPVADAQRLAAASQSDWVDGSLALKGDDAGSILLASEMV